MSDTRAATQSSAQPRPGAAVPVGVADTTTRRLDDLAGEVHPATVARHFTRSTLQLWAQPEQLVETVELATSELVANAVQHGNGATGMALTRSGATIRVEVEDRSDEHPVVMRPRPLEEGHRGLLIIESVCARWGYEQTASGKTVWAEFPRVR